jgi:hypothetical protein
MLTGRSAVPLPQTGQFSLAMHVHVCVQWSGQEILTHHDQPHHKHNKQGWIHFATERTTLGIRRSSYTWHRVCWAIMWSQQSETEFNVGMGCHRSFWISCMLSRHTDWWTWSVSTCHPQNQLLHLTVYLLTSKGCDVRKSAITQSHHLACSGTITCDAITSFHDL